MTEWFAYLDGDAADLDALAGLFPAGDLLRREEGRWVVAGKRLALGNADDVRDEAQRLITEIRGLALVLGTRVGNIAVHSVVRRDPDGKRHIFVKLEGVEARVRV